MMVASSARWTAGETLKLATPISAAVAVERCSATRKLLAAPMATPGRAWPKTLPRLDQDVSRRS